MKRTTPIKIKKKKGKPKKKANAKLSPKEQKFVDLYLLGKVSEKPLYNYEYYMQVYNCTNVRNAQSLSDEVLRRPHVKHYIKKAQKKALQKTEITLERILKGLIRIAEFDKRKLFDEEGNVIPIHKLDDDTALGLSSIEYGTYQINIINKKKKKTIKKSKVYLKKVTHESRKAAWDSIGNFQHMFDKDKQEATAQDFVQDVRGFADYISNAVPGGKL